MAAVGMGVAAAAADLTEELFLYNRENFQFDRKQRQIMEYQLANMQMEQAKLWREDIRDFCTLTPEKMEVYLLVVALELGFCVMALCKARAPPGCPPWLVNCHTISVCGALMYLFLALWFGMHAFVSAQAYKVRILTQMVRLPVPSWKAIEASRTYSSAFEQINKAQMLRVPFAQGTQESLAQRCHDSATPDPTEMDGAALIAGAHAGPAANSSDPWGLERRGDNLQELAPDVNVGVERQRHIWLVREAAKFYQTYDAYCRISMSAGTSNLAIFFCYYCMTYVLTENAAPTAAWAGVLVFVICSLTLLRSDLELNSWQYTLQGVLIFISPVLSFYVTYMSSKHQGDVGSLKIMCCLVLFLHGASLMTFLMLFRVRETQTGAVLPTAFKRILYIDPFGWANHSASHWRKARKHTDAVREVNARLGLKKSPSVAGRIWSSLRRTSTASSSSESPVMRSPSEHCVKGSVPLRPEDVEELGSGTSAVHTTFSPILVRERSRENPNVSFRPGTFASGEDETEDSGGRGSNAQSDISTGTDVSGEKPGIGPWRVFQVNTIFLALAWEAAFVETVARSVSSKLNFHHSLKIPTYGLRPGEIAKLPGLIQDHGGNLGHAWGSTWQPMQPALVGERLQTTWNHGLSQPRGLACDRLGTHFLTSGRASDGSAGIVHGRLVTISNSVEFGPSSTCTGVNGHTGMRIQDVALHTCTDDGCTALVLQKEATHLAACHSRSPGQQRNMSNDVTGSNNPGKVRTLPLSQMWLDDRGGVPSRGRDHERPLLHPERVSAIGTVPCESSKAKDHPEGCMVVGTTARRGVHMAVAGEREWRPSALLWSNRGEVPDAGTLAAVGSRYLAALQKGPGAIQLLDLQKGGAMLASWRLLTPAAHHGRWSSVCAGGGHFYALEEGQQPAIWRFRMPPEFALED